MKHSIAILLISLSCAFAAEVPDTQFPAFVVFHGGNG